MKTITLFESKVFTAPDAASRYANGIVADGAVQLISAQTNNGVYKPDLLVYDGERVAVNGFGAAIPDYSYALNYDRFAEPTTEAHERLDQLPASVKRLATLLDRRPEPLHIQPYTQVIAASTYQLNTSAISTLIRVVDAADEDAQTAFAVLDGQHRQLATYAWYGDWSAVALPAVLFGGLTRNGLLDLLREARRRRRRERVRPARPTAFVVRLRGQLERLANFIAPNAPPRGADIRVVAGVAAI
jgi:hypothetical protein